MMSKLDKITYFIEQHHVMSLATSYNDIVSACSLFYVYDSREKIFVVASSDDTLHINHIQKNNRIAGNILLETKEVGKIQGVQFQGIFSLLDNVELSELYFKTYPYSLEMQPKLWKIEVDYFKMTNNELGFGKKIIWDCK